jgi:hypothetical protein
VWVDRQGRESPVPAKPDQILRATVSRDGRRVAYDVNRSAEWVVDLSTAHAYHRRRAQLARWLAAWR